MGVSATGKRVSFEGMHMFAFVDSKITEHWSVLDLLGLMTQLGVGPRQQGGTR